jgi:hypothetical protein
VFAQQYLVVDRMSRFRKHFTQDTTRSDIEYFHKLITNDVFDIVLIFVRRKVLQQLVCSLLVVFASDWKITMTRSTLNIKTSDCQWSYFLDIVSMNRTPMAIEIHFAESG